MQVQTRGEFGGLGIEVTMENGVVKVVSPIDDTPAAKAGLQSNDLITHLDGEQIVGLTLEQAVEKMRGPVNTPINLTIIRRGKDEPFDVKIVRDVIRINAVKARLEGDIIYVKISTFNEQTHANLVKAGRCPEEAAGQARTRLRHRSAKQSRRPARPGDRRLRRFPRQGRDRADQGPGPGGNAARQRAGRRYRRGQAGRGAYQRRLGVGFRDRRGRIAGPQARDRDRHAFLRQGFGADHHSARCERRHPPDDSALLHPLRPSIQAKGIEPDVVVEQELPPELQTKAPQRTPSEASLRGHLKNDNKDARENTGSSSYVPKEPEKDNQLQYALKMLRGEPLPPAVPRARGSLPVPLPPSKQ